MAVIVAVMHISEKMLQWIDQLNHLYSTISYVACGLRCYTSGWQKQTVRGNGSLDGFTGRVGCVHRKLAASFGAVSVSLLFVYISSWDINYLSRLPRPELRQMDRLGGIKLLGLEAAQHPGRDWDWERQLPRLLSRTAAAVPPPGLAHQLR